MASGFPAPVLSTGPTITKVQQALIDIGFAMPVNGADGTFGDETAAAVVAFKNEWEIMPNDPVIGPKTMGKLDSEMLAFERRAAPPPPPPPPPPQFVAMESKVFTADTIQGLEQQINEWLAQNPGIEIQFAAQSESDAQPNGWSITFTILYKKIDS
jgi:peptidoglycan hydrolase-like protein with peptidoglycan-binding domain